MTKLHQFADPNSNNYQPLPKPSHSLQLHATTERIATNNRASCCLLQGLVRLHQSLHSKNQHGDAIRRAKIGQQAYPIRALRGDAHPFLHFHHPVEPTCGHAPSRVQDYPGPSATALPTSGGEEHHPILELQLFLDLSIRSHCQVEIDERCQKHPLPNQGFVNATHLIQLEGLGFH